MTASRKLKGRPILTEGKRTKKIDTRFTEDEYKTVLALEKALGIRKTDIVRNRVLQNAPGILVNAKEVIELLNTIGTELGRSGNNINQLARYANTLRKRNILSPVVIERFNMLFESYISNQKELETVLRKIIRVMGR
jgi:hypothetical protein